MELTFEIITIFSLVPFFIYPSEQEKTSPKKVCFVSDVNNFAHLQKNGSKIDPFGHIKTSNQAVSAEEVGFPSKESMEDFSEDEFAAELKKQNKEKEKNKIVKRLRKFFVTL